MRIIIAITCFLSLFQLSCKKEKDAVSLASEVGFAAAQSATEADAMLTAALDLVKDFKNPSNWTVIPSSAKITYIDSSFSDFTGVSFRIDFGPVRSNKPRGMLCLDGKYRSGVLECSMRAPYLDSGNRINAHHLNEFYTGNGTEMFLMKGNINLLRTGQTSWQVNEDLEIDALHLSVMSWKADLTMNQNNGSHSYLGTSSGVSSSEGKSYNLTISDPLVKKENCPNTFIKGICDISVNSEVIFLDFNPYSDQVCDEVARTSLNRFEKIFYIH